MSLTIGPDIGQIKIQRASVSSARSLDFPPLLDLLSTNCSAVQPWQRLGPRQSPSGLPTWWATLTCCRLSLPTPSLQVLRLLRWICSYLCLPTCDRSSAMSRIRYSCPPAVFSQNMVPWTPFETQTLAETLQYYLMIFNSDNLNIRFLSDENLVRLSVR